MSVKAGKSPRNAGWTPPAAHIHEEYYPVQSFAWIGKSGDAAGDFPHCGDADYDQIEDTGLGALSMGAHGDAAYLVWRVPQQMNVNEKLGIKLAYTSEGTAADTTGTASGRIAWKLSFAGIAEGDEMSGASYTNMDDNGVDFEEIVYSGNTAYSGEAKLMTSSWAEIFAHKNNSQESGNNFRHGDMIVFKITRDSGAASTYVPAALLGATIRYHRDRL
jgi:hypothetical protein